MSDNIPVHQDPFPVRIFVIGQVLNGYYRTSLSSDYAYSQNEETTNVYKIFECIQNFVGVISFVKIDLRKSACNDGRCM
jgi:hypothetical protein